MKQKISLLSNSDNLLNVPQSTIDAFILDESMKQTAISSIKLFLKRASNHFSVNIINKQLDNDLKNFDFVYMSKYPLPVSFNKMTKKGIINTAIFNKRDVINIDPRDLYTILLYCYVFTMFTFLKIKPSMISVISDFMFSLYMKVYGKKYGLVGGYQSEIPKLKFFLNVYIMVSFFEIPQDKTYIPSANVSHVDLKNIGVNIKEYDFREIKDLIKCLSDSDVLKGVNTYYFVSTMINRFLPHNICMFEDVVRFLSIIAASSINANTLCPSNIQFYHKESYDKILKYIEFFM